MGKTMNEPKVEEEAAPKEDSVEVMQCSEHPNRSNPSGICAICLQEKLGKLVSSSASMHLHASSSSSTSPSFRSDAVSENNSATVLRHSKAKVSDDSAHHSRIRIPFILAKRSERESGTFFRRSKSVHSTPARRTGAALLDGGYSDYSVRRRGFWSFLYHSGPSKSRPAAGSSSNEKGENAGPERKVRRSRSVGCGSRSFSGDFFEKISNGFVDCTHGEGKRRSMKETVKCGGLFGGFVVPSSHLVSSGDERGRKSTAERLTHGRIKGWGWAKKITTKPEDSKPEEIESKTE